MGWGVPACARTGLQRGAGDKGSASEERECGAQKTGEAECGWGCRRCAAPKEEALQKFDTLTAASGPAWPYLGAGFVFCHHLFSQGIYGGAGRGGAGLEESVLRTVVCRCRQVDG
ncbi:unnamed protein product [Cuscuta europaea]|uniref:Uncharacterized protein n=1 Tax=Cuscuta europaea TaxID=41803 RepID=A0A9P0ZCC0_CUSEU|nr:unnamed protein product [Cuscuta europaea]